MPAVELARILELEPHGPDTFVGTGPQYPWGGLYGGQIVAQALQAATLTVASEFSAHSLRAYFIRRGDHNEPVRYEVDRLRNGRSFCTRRVVARQAVGAILNLEASFQVEEESENVEIISMPGGIPGPDELPQESWSPAFDRAFVPNESLTEDRTGGGREVAWFRLTAPVDPSMSAAALAFLSDDIPTGAVVRAHPLYLLPEEERWPAMFSASLDHTIWFHRRAPVEDWQLHDFTCHTYVGGRGLAIGHVFAVDGTHVATVAQEVLLRDTRRRSR